MNFLFCLDLKALVTGHFCGIFLVVFFYRLFLGTLYSSVPFLVRDRLLGETRYLLLVCEKCHQGAWTSIYLSDSIYLCDSIQNGIGGWWSDRLIRPFPISGMEVGPCQVRRYSIFKKILQLAPIEWLTRLGTGKLMVRRISGTPQGWNNVILILLQLT